MLPYSGTPRTEIAAYLEASLNFSIETRNMFRCSTHSSWSWWNEIIVVIVLVIRLCQSDQAMVLRWQDIGSI